MSAAEVRLKVLSYGTPSWKFPLGIVMAEFAVVLVLSWGIETPESPAAYWLMACVLAAGFFLIAQRPGGVLPGLLAAAAVGLIAFLPALLVGDDPLPPYTVYVLLTGFISIALTIKEAHERLVVSLVAGMIVFFAGVGVRALFG